MTASLPLMKSVLTPLANIFLITLGLSAGISVADAAIHREIYGSGTTALRISHEEKEDIVKSHEETGLLIKGVSETIKNGANEQNGRLLSMSLGTLAASLLGNELAGKRVLRAGEGVVRTGENF